MKHYLVGLVLLSGCTVNLSFDVELPFLDQNLSGEVEDTIEGAVSNVVPSFDIPPEEVADFELGAVELTAQDFPTMPYFEMTSDCLLDKNTASELGGVSSWKATYLAVFDIAAEDTHWLHSTYTTISNCDYISVGEWPHLEGCHDTKYTDYFRLATVGEEPISLGIPCGTVFGAEDQEPYGRYSSTVSLRFND